MKINSGALIVLLTISVTVILAQGNRLPQPQSGYSGVRTIQIAGSTMEATVNAEGAKERSEMLVEGQLMTSIKRQDLGIIWMLLPGGIYMELPMNGPTPGTGAPPSTLTDANLVELVEEGRDQVNGWDTTRFRFSAENPDGSLLDGLIWLTNQNIPIRTSMTVQALGRTDEVNVELQDLELGDQPDSLFELPDGYQKMSMPGGP